MSLDGEENNKLGMQNVTKIEPKTRNQALISELNAFLSVIKKNVSWWFCVNIQDARSVNVKRMYEYMEIQM